MPDFTPGPWILEDKPSAGLEIKALIPELSKYRPQDGGPTIWTVPRDTAISATSKPQSLIGYEPWVQFPPKWWIEMSKANAQLISAAPDMYEALKLVMSYLGPSETWQEGEEIIAYKISQVLLKADGGAIKA